MVRVQWLNPQPYSDFVRPRPKNVLEDARAHAMKTSGFSWTEFRKQQRERMTALTNGSSPYLWQLVASEALHHRLDTLLISGAGDGKTWTFILPLVEDEEKKSMVLIVAPMNPLPIENYQAKEFERFGLPTLVLKEANDTSQVLQKFQERMPWVVLASPEVVFTDPSFQDLLSSKEFRENVKPVVFDEAHLIPEWEKEYGDLSRIRTWLPSGVPVLAASATVGGDEERSIRRNLSFDDAKTYVMHRDNQIKNVLLDVRRMQGDMELAKLDFIVKDDLDKGLPIRKTLVFTRSDAASRGVTAHLQKILPYDDFGLVQPLDPRCEPFITQCRLECFRSGRMPVLVVPESVEMGIGKDMLDIVGVVQVQSPLSLSTMWQHMGRAGRDRKLQAEGIALTQSYYFQDDPEYSPPKGRYLVEVDIDEEPDENEKCQCHVRCCKNHRCRIHRTTNGVPDDIQTTLQ